MDKFTVLEGVAAPLKMINVDTDMIIPKQYLKTVAPHGLGKALFRAALPGRRLREPGFHPHSPPTARQGAGRRQQFRLRLEPRACPWALADFGIRCVISTQFGDIFYNNCFKNGCAHSRSARKTWRSCSTDADAAPTPR